MMKIFSSLNRIRSTVDFVYFSAVVYSEHVIKFILLISQCSAETQIR